MLFVSLRVPSWILFLLFFVVTVIAQPSAKLPAAKPPAVKPPTYADLRPVLEARCVVCHKQANLSNLPISGGLALDTLDALRKGVVTKTGTRPILHSGKSAESELYLRLVATSPTKLM